MFNSGDKAIYNPKTFTWYEMFRGDKVTVVEYLRYEGKYVIRFNDGGCTRTRCGNLSPITERDIETNDIKDLF